MKYRYAGEAEEELAAHLEYVAERSPAAARRILDEVTQTVEALAAGEYDGPEEQLMTGEIVHKWTGRTLIVYYQREPRCASLLVATTAIAPEPFESPRQPTRGPLP